MSKQKKLRKILIDKLFNQNEHSLKQSTRSNAPTQSTPNEPKDFSKAIHNFFQNFQTQCAIIYEPVKPKHHKPLKRSLQAELQLLSLDNEKSKSKDQSPLFSSIERQLMKKSSKNNLNVYKQQSLSRQGSKSTANLSKMKQKKPLISDRYISTIKTQSILSASISPSHSKLLPKPKPHIDSTSLSKISNRSQHFQNLKSHIQKSISHLEKQLNQYMTNSKTNLPKEIIKNAPKKLPQKPLKPDRIKRIQSLKNLNDNGIRKYSYKRDL